ncbi:MAG: hypothetical protein ACJAVK_000232 [Akkermansiaceae bacterium]|jgi:hypothetical protein
MNFPPAYELRALKTWLSLLKNDSKMSRDLALSGDPFIVSTENVTT